MEENIADSSSRTPFNIADHLPLRLFKSEVIPPAPNRLESGHEPPIDWLYDFAGYTWIAYGAASLLVLSHLPNPLSETESIIGPLFRQVFELSVDGTGIVSAVAWSHAIPSVGDLAATLDCCIGIFSYNSDTTANSSFCWSQRAILVQSTKVESIQWTISGDGIVAGGVEVTLWKNNTSSWERIWKFKRPVPQVLISASWSIEGLLATAPLCKLQVEGLFSQTSETINSVMVSCGDRLPDSDQAELCHPLPISMIQWRPSTGKPTKGGKTPVRAVLITGCLDGAVRFWSECDDGRTKKAAKDSDDHKAERLSFRVTAVIEVDQALDGILGSNVFVRWGAEVESIVCTGDDCFSKTDYLHDRTGNCEWLIGFGPKCTVTLWAIHCLDDFSPLRFPRVTLWKKQELTGPELGKGGRVLGAVFVARNKWFSPPTMCSMAVLLPCNYLAWLQLYRPTSPDRLEKCLNNSCSDALLSSYSFRNLDIDSFSGNLVQVVVHPSLFGIGIAASLDSFGMILFWSLSTASNSISGLPIFCPSFQVLGKSVISGSCPGYTSLGWIPTIFNDDRILVIGHSGGIDCVIVKAMESEAGKIACHLVCTIPFGMEGFSEGPTSVHAVPLPSISDKLLFHNNSFMLVAIWRNNFKALSWKMTIHQCDSQGNCFNCSKENKNTSGNRFSVFDYEFCDRKYHIFVDPYSSTFPAAQNDDEITSFAVISTTDSVVTEQRESDSEAEFFGSHSAYHLVTGSYYGVVKLWRSQPAKLPSLNSQWELVGVLGVLKCPVVRISASVSGRKIATVSPSTPLSTGQTLCIWECVNLGSAGSFLLEDRICIGANVVCVNWLMEDGQSLLGVCLQNELKIFARRRSGGQAVLKLQDAVEESSWACIASIHTHPVIHSFFWGPKATVGIVHLDYFCVLSQYSMMQTDNVLSKSCPENCRSNSIVCKNCSHENLMEVFTDFGKCDLKESSGKESCQQSYFPIPMNTHVRDYPLSIIDVESFRQACNSSGKVLMWNLSEVAEILGGSLPAFHPEALLWNMSSGNWKRAFVALQHLVEHLASSKISGEHYLSGSRAIPQVPLSNYLEATLSSSSGENTFTWSGEVNVHAPVSQTQGAFQFATSGGYPPSNNGSISSRSHAMDFTEAFQKLHASAGITSCEKIQIAAIMNILQEVSDPYTASAYGSLDEPGRRFWVAVKFQQQYFVQKFGRLPLKGKGELVVSSELIGWAFHSDCQDNLCSSLLSDQPSWPEIRDMGVGFWYSNPVELRSKKWQDARKKTEEKPQFLVKLIEQFSHVKHESMFSYTFLNGIESLLLMQDFEACLRENEEKLKLRHTFMGKMEKLARQQYLNRKDPKDCALLYIALNRLQVLAGLFKMSKNEKDKPLVGFLSRNFQDEKNKAAALKNAYVLMGKHQLELAIAFFLLGGDTSSAVTVCSKNLGDEQLALVICRLLEGNGGQLEHNLLSKSVLPSAISSCDYWLASVFEWALGNYSQAFLRMLDMPRISIDVPLQTACQASFLDPSVGQYCLMLANKTRMKKAVGEQHATIFSRWGVLLSYVALSKCGLSIEGLECLSSSICNSGDSSQGSLPNDEVLHLFPYKSSSNWVSCGLTSLMDLYAKSDLAMQHISTLLREHPSWLNINIESFQTSKLSKSENQEHLLLVENFLGKLAVTLGYLQQKYSLIPFDLITKIMLSFCRNGLAFIGYHIFCDFVPKFLSEAQSCGVKSFVSLLPELLLKDSRNISLVFSRYIISCCMSCSQRKTCSANRRMKIAHKPIYWLGAWEVYRHSLIWSFWCLRAALKLFFTSHGKYLLDVNLVIIDLSVYCAYFASVWIQKNFEDLSVFIKPLLARCSQEDSPSETINNPGEILFEIRNVLKDDLSRKGVGVSIKCSREMLHEQGGDSCNLKSEDGRLLVMGFPLWGQISWFLKHLLKSLPEIVEHADLSHPMGELQTIHAFHDDEQVNNNLKLSIAQESHIKLLNGTCEHLSAYCTRQFASYLMQKEEDITNFLSELEDGKDFSLPGSRIDHADVPDKENEGSPTRLFLLKCANLKLILRSFLKETTNWLKYIPQNSSRGWADVYFNIQREGEAREGASEENRIGISSRTGISPTAGHSPDDHPTASSMGKDTKKILPFNSPKEIYRRSGELLEALCINSVDQQQAAIATNRKGIIFFNWEDGIPHIDESEYIWAEADWPQNGWAGSESTPIPTCVSPGVGLGSRKGTHLGLGGATVGVNRLERPSRDLLSGGAFGRMGYAGMGLHSLGWGVEEDFEQYVDPPPTLESVKTSAFSSHPSKPLFLVGSSNTHVYLWEFGKDRATATYGVLPAANVPPPYALASVSSVQFDHCGQRFVTAALDGTVCTWQLEVGGRNNVHPAESSVCFDNYTMDATYVGASGSIVAAAGYSSSGINVVIWDTLAPSATSRATIMCHEGGAESLSVFDNNVGSGSISPLIVTGGKGGDVGLHDFRYIVTGRTKKHKLSDDMPLTVDMRNKTGDQNRNGMLWYIPKAHAGSVTKISTIPNTSFFLTGGKDGDVKLWDAKTARLVHHFPKLHDRHTFLQPSPHGFGGIVRAAVTDIQIVSNGFLTSGGDGFVKLVKLQDIPKTWETFKSL